MRGGGFGLVGVLPGPEGKPAMEASLGWAGDVRHAISDDGTRVIFSNEVGTPGGLYERDTVSSETVQVAGPGAEFQIASDDGLKVFFSGKVRGGDLDEFDAVTGKVTDLTPDEDNAQVQGVLGASEDGSYVYFVANGVFAPGAEPGNCEDTGVGVCNLYAMHYNGSSWMTKFIAQVTGGDLADWDVTYLAGLSARVSPDGRFLAFMSLASLTGYDNKDVNSGQPDAEVYIYNAESGRLTCASCNPTGARPVGEGDDNTDSASRWNEAGREVAAQIPGWTPFNDHFAGASYQSRYLSDEGRLFFETSEALVAQDTNGTQDVYEYEPEGVGSCSLKGGCVYLISGGTGSSASFFVDASASGEDVFFVTGNRLVSQDVDNVADMYDAHMCSAAAACFATPPVVPPACTSSDACKPGPTPQPTVFGAPPSATFSGLGNQPSSAGATAVKTGKSKKRKTSAKRRKRKRGHRAKHAALAGRSSSTGGAVVGRGERGGHGHDTHR
jgi:hypothetical protein